MCITNLSTVGRCLGSIDPALSRSSCVDYPGPYGNPKALCFLKAPPGLGFPLTTKPHLFRRTPFIALLEGCRRLSDSRSHDRKKSSAEATVTPDCCPSRFGEHCEVKEAPPTSSEVPDRLQTYCFRDNTPVPPFTMAELRRTPQPMYTCSVPMHTLFTKLCIPCSVLFNTYTRFILSSLLN